MDTYQTVFITVPNLTDDEESAIVNDLAEVVTSGGGSFAANDRMGRRRLAYPIRKFEDGVYTLFLYDAESAVPIELERRFGLSDKVLRHLTVKLEAEWATERKEEVVRQAKARAEAEAARIAAEAEAAARAEEEAAKKAEAAEAAEAGREDAEAPIKTDEAKDESEESIETKAAESTAKVTAPADDEAETPADEKTDKE